MAIRPETVQFQLIQALRGVAACWVVLFHLYMGEYCSDFIDALPGPAARWLFEYGSSGVAIFFVLSGFVIAHSLTGQPMTARAFGRFAARRSMRLDPPYWAAILLSVAVSAIAALWRNEHLPLPTGDTLFLHLFYLQEIMGAPEINIVFWTLAYEIQFYLILAGSGLLATTLVRRGLARQLTDDFVFRTLALLAFAAALAPEGWAPHGLFADLWHAFFLGVCAYRAGPLQRSPAVLMALVLATLAGAQYRTGIFGTPAALTALGLFFAARTGYLRNGLDAAPFRYLGRISYSLYLIHVPLMVLTHAVWTRLAGRGLIADMFGLLVICVTLLLAASMFWWLIERPSHRLASSLFRRAVKPTAVELEKPPLFAAGEALSGSSRPPF